MILVGLVAEVGFGFNIPFTYACWGVALPMVRRWSTPALLLTAALASAARPVVAEATALWAWWTGTPLPSRVNQALAQAVDAAVQQGEYPSLLLARRELFAGTLSGWRWLLPDTNVALFILGLLAVRYGVLDQPRRHTRLIAALMIGGAVSWAASWLVLRNLPERSIPGTA